MIDRAKGLMVLRNDIYHEIKAVAEKLGRFGWFFMGDPGEASERDILEFMRYPADAHLHMDCEEVTAIAQSLIDEYQDLAAYKNRLIRAKERNSEEIDAELKRIEGLNKEKRVVLQSRRTV